MDRKAWIVVTLCALGMVANFWYSSKKQQEWAAEQARLEASKPKTEAVKPASGDAAPATVEAGAAPATPPAAALPEEKHTLTVGSVTYHFTSKGAGVAKAVLAAGDRITLNETGKKTLEPVGALRREATGLDTVVYKVVEKSDKGITFEGTNADGITIRKAYSVTEGEKSDEHLLALTVTLTNTGKVHHKSEEYYLYAGARRTFRLR